MGGGGGGRERGMRDVVKLKGSHTLAQAGKAFPITYN